VIVSFAVGPFGDFEEIFIRCDGDELILNLPVYFDSLTVSFNVGAVEKFSLVGAAFSGPGVVLSGALAAFCPMPAAAGKVLGCDPPQPLKASARMLAQAGAITEKEV
jgi:hypothetical protein